ncbi:cob(I)yrinic acid a,c-diamide adenosyltransferase [Bacteriovorax sp. PP10]|uniref:Corrinoid adenosyltransferase n=1 Tax=Bacteriovorax antarcticus TaxID=3088717 RepID=A0ABU5VPA7_9BACT|nr:cob(I)yrinic acid a,c-diamide adenosyltransferase [Bacteriovorax sp. PP10]MEA9354873.1 cob(I)yrinic acid a,c-diamide adenosyltransferase [Bacteriovorax sp. PP10]
MKKSAVYTRTGDKGITGLVGGTRIKKSDSRIHLYGEVDELNSYIGLGISFLDKSFDKSLLQQIQSSLFDLGSNLACEKEKRSQFKLPQIKTSSIEKLESDIDQMDSQLIPLKHFILPGGSSAAAAFHVCRTVCRRIERQMVDFEEQNPGEVPENALQYMNRLSDYFFILSRYLNSSNQIEETQWIPEA